MNQLLLLDTHTQALLLKQHLILLCIASSAMTEWTLVSC